jgi:hypothetical protein
MEGSPATVSRGAAGLERLSAAVAGIHWIAVLRIAIGALFVSVFFENLNKDLYTADGYSALIRDYAERNNAPGFWRNGVMEFFADNSSVFAPLQAVTELSLGILLVLAIATGAVALVAVGLFTMLWISELGIFWVWELLSVMIMAAVVSLANLPRLVEDRPLGERLLGPRSYRRLSLRGRMAAAVAAGAALALAILAAKTGGGSNYKDVALQAGVAFGLLMLALAFLDERRSPEP